MSRWFSGHGRWGTGIRREGLRLFSACLSLSLISLISLTCWQESPTVAEAAIRTIYFYHPDHLGSTNLVTDERGQVVQLTEYTPFGAVATHTGPATLPHQFTGQRADASTGLYFYNARYYDPQLGRFIQPDPIVQTPEDPQFLNRYSYVRNNPVRLIDPSGNLAFLAFLGALVIKAIIGAMVGAAVTVTVGAATGQVHSAKDFGRFVAAGAASGAVMAGGGYLIGVEGIQLAGSAKVLAELAITTASGAAYGGVDSLIQGSSFGRGVVYGALSGLASFWAGALIGASVRAIASTPVGESIRGRIIAAGETILEGSVAKAIQRFLAKFQLGPSPESPFRPGELFQREFTTSQGTVGLLAEPEIRGDTLILKHLAVFPYGSDEPFELGTREVMRHRQELAREVKDLGFKQLRITGQRSTGANKGKIVDLIIDLTKIR